MRRVLLLLITPLMVWSVGFGILNIQNAQAAITFEDTFESYSNGGLNGLNGGTGWAGAWSNGTGDWDIQSTVVYQGTKATTASVNSARREFAALTGNGNVLYFAARRSSNAATRSSIYLTNSSESERTQIDFTGGNITIPGHTLVSGYASNQWYVFRMTINVDAGNYTVATSTDAFGPGGTFGADSAAVSFTSTGDIVKFLSQTDNLGTEDWFIDYISPTSPFAAAAAAVTTTICVNLICSDV